VNRYVIFFDDLVDSYIENITNVPKS